MVFQKNAPLYSVQVERKEGENVMYMNFLGAPYVPSIVENSEVMARVVDALCENSNVSRIIFVQQRNYHYNFEQVSLLADIARLYTYFIKEEKILSPEKLQFLANVNFAHGELSYLLSLLRQDPVGCYLSLKKKIREYTHEISSGVIVGGNSDRLANYIRYLERFQRLLERTNLFEKLGERVDRFSIGDREVYREVFRPDILPNFTFTRLVAQLPEDSELIDQYEVSTEEESIPVTILRKKNDSRPIYHVRPEEYALSEEQHMLLGLGRNVLIEHEPKSEEFTDSEKTRAVFFNIARDLLGELSQSKGIGLSYKELNKLARILVRQTIGFGSVEVLLMDDKIQDVYLNSPIAQNPIFIRHSKYGECVTNIVPSYEDADSWAAKLRLQSGRPLDEANPVLDTDLLFGKVRARVAAIQKPLSAHGIAYALRRHRDQPWTLPLFIENKMINSFGAGLMSFFIDGARTMLIAGTRSSGKTSLLGSLMLEIMPSVRTISVEDSVTGDSRIVIKENGKFRKTTIGEFIDEKIKKQGFVDMDGRHKELNSDGVEVFSVDNQGKVVLSKASKFIRHKVNKQIYEVTTTSGKKIKVTEDHSLFTLDEKEILKNITPKEMREGDFVAVPLKLPFDTFLKKINLLDKLDKLNKKIFISGRGVEEYIENNRKKLFEMGFSLDYKKSTIQNWTIKKILPLDIFYKIKGEINEANLFIRSIGSTKKVPSEILFDDVFLSFIGLWLADGCYDNNSVIISVQEEENRKIVREVARRFNLNAKFHSDKFSLMINSTLLKSIMQNVLELKGNSYTKQIPSWAYNLSDDQIGWILKGFFSGDGCVSDKEIIFSICSTELIKDIATLLLRFGIILRTNLDLVKKDKTYNCRIGTTEMIKKFRENINFLVDSKKRKLERLSLRVSTHDVGDVIPLNLDVKKELKDILGGKFNANDYIVRNNNLGRRHLSKLLKSVPMGITNPIDPLRKIVDSDIFWDKVKLIKKVEIEGDVYDISVPGNENFICENIIAHNTLELPVAALRKLGYNIQSMKVRSALLESTTEVAASEGIRTSLRLGDSGLIIGEVRSEEAKALYEAMRVGALANVVAGTIHGASPYGVFDRVVNDLGVPVTSFKATDLVAIANPIKTPDGLHSKKRVVQLAEVRKHWTKDPIAEKGFVDLMKYNVRKDELEPTEELINGDSEIVKGVATNVKGWAGDWDAVYDNIILRGKIKQALVDLAKKLKKPGIMEAKFNMLSNDAFHRISDEVTQEIGLPSSDVVFPKWKKWVEKMVKH